MTVLDYRPLTQLVYIAYFGRPADPAGLMAFAQGLSEAVEQADITNLALQYSEPQNAALRALIDGFGQSTESKLLYDNGTTAGFVELVFRNILGRSAKQAGLDYWSAEIDSGRVTKAQAALQIMTGAFLNKTDPLQAALDQATITNKLAVAMYFTGLIDTPAEQDAYRGQDAARKVRDMLGWVNQDTDPAAFQPTAQSILRMLTGEAPAADSYIVLDDSTAFTGGAGPDRVTVGATTRTIVMGDGDDVVKLTVSALGNGGMLDGGAGIDTLVMSGTDATGVAGNRSFGDVLAGFERLSLTDVTNRPVNLDNLDGIAHVSLSGAHATAINGLVLNRLASGGTVALDTGAAALTVNVKDAASGAADVLNLSATSDSGVGMGIITALHVETVNFLTSNTFAVRLGTVHNAQLIAPAASTITVKGNAGFALTLTGTALTLFDASGETGEVVFRTGALTSAAVIKGGSGTSAIDWFAATKSVTYTGGNGMDIITTNDADNVLKTGFGDDRVTLGSGANMVNLGHGHDDVRIVRGGANVITGGEGFDNYFLDGTGAHSGSAFTTITDFALSERIRFSGVERFIKADHLGAAISLGQGASFQQYLDAAAAGGVGGELRWFVTAGATYVVNDVSSSGSFQNGLDQVVKLVGVIDLSGGSFSADGVLWGMSM